MLALRSFSEEVVPGRGLEPPWDCSRTHLKGVRLPVSPPGHILLLLKYCTRTTKKNPPPISIQITNRPLCDDRHKVVGFRYSHQEMKPDKLISLPFLRLSTTISPRQRGPNKVEWVSFSFEVNEMNEVIPIFPAIDKMSLRRALNLTAEIGPLVPAVKVHAVAEPSLSFVFKEFYREGAKGIWLDFKDCDMPDTIEERASSAKDAGATMLTVHAFGGPKMIEKAVKFGPPTIIAVMLLTSYTPEMIEYLFTGQTLDQVVKKLANWAVQGGAHAIVCPPTQVASLSTIYESRGIKFIIPGTRSVGVAHHDQKQVDTPYNTIVNGAAYLVGGRQITQSDNPRGELLAMGSEIKLGLEERAKRQQRNYLETFSG